MEKRTLAQLRDALRVAHFAADHYQSVYEKTGSPAANTSFLKALKVEAELEEELEAMIDTAEYENNAFR